MRPFLRTLLLILCAAIVLPGQLAAQVIQPSRPQPPQSRQERQPSWTDKWILGVSGFGGIPVGEFKDHEDGGGGAEFVLGFQPFRGQPLSLRGNASFMDYGGVRQRGFQESCDAFGNCWFDEIEFDASDHTMFVFQGGAELMPTVGAWRPFAFALAGTTLFRSNATITATSPSGPEQETESIFSSSNFSASYGVGIRRITVVGGRELGFELSTRFLQNAKASYLTEESVTQNPDGSYTTTPRNGAANIVGIHLGVWLGPPPR
jgi:hypothetical protein